MVYRLVLGLRKPWHVILGTELSGVVEAVGRQVIHFSFGDPVLAFPGGRMGRQAGYRCRAADGPVCFRPANLSHQQAVSHCFGGTSMLACQPDGAGAPVAACWWCRPEYVRQLGLIASGGAFTPVLEGRHALLKEQAAHRRVDSGRKQGSVVLVMDPGAVVAQWPHAPSRRT